MARVPGRGVVIVLSLAMAAPAARADEVAPPIAAPGPTAVPGPTAAPEQTPAPAGEELSKTECLARHEYAQVARRQRRLLDARGELLLCSRASCPGPIRGDCIDWLGEVGRSLPSVVVTARARGADVVNVRVFLDGRLVSEKLSGAALDLDPGEHRFRFESPPWPPVERTILVSEGIKDRPIDVELAPPDPVAPPPAQPKPKPPFQLRKYDYVLGAIAVAGLGAFAYFGGSALYERNRLLGEGGCAPFCKPHEVDVVDSRLIAADVALGVAVVAALVDLYLHATQAGDEVAPASRASVVVGARGGARSLAVRARF
jgi:hypothetical protein